MIIGDEDKHTSFILPCMDEAINAPLIQSSLIILMMMVWEPSFLNSSYSLEPMCVGTHSDFVWV